MSMVSRKVNCTVPEEYYDWCRKNAISPSRLLQLAIEEVMNNASHG